MTIKTPSLAIAFSLVLVLILTDSALAGGISGGTPPSWSEEDPESTETTPKDGTLDHEVILKTIPASSVRRNLRGFRLIPLAEPSLRYLQNKVWEYGTSPIYLDDGTLFELQSSLGGTLVDRIRAARVILKPEAKPFPEESAFTPAASRDI